MPRFCKQQKKIKSSVNTCCLPVFTNVSDRNLCPFSFCPEMLLGAALCTLKLFQPRDISRWFDGRSRMSEKHTARRDHCVQQQICINGDTINHLTIPAQTLKLTEAEGRAGALSIPLYQ